MRSNYSLRTSRSPSVYSVTAAARRNCTRGKSSEKGTGIIVSSTARLRFFGTRCVDAPRRAAPGPFLPIACIPVAKNTRHASRVAVKRTAVNPQLKSILNDCHKGRVMTTMGHAGCRLLELCPPAAPVPADNRRRPRTGIVIPAKIGPLW